MATQAGPTELGMAMEAESESIGDDDRRLNRTLVRLLGDGRPVEAARLADALGRSEPETAAALLAHPMVYTDDDRRVIGAWGLALGEELAETPHRIGVGSRELHGWCAFDALFVPLVLGEDAVISSRSPGSGEPVGLTIANGTLTDLSPPDAVMSALLPGDLNVDVIRSYCHFIHFFASPAGARRWIDEHEGTFQLPIDDGFALARFWAARAFGVELDPGSEPTAA